MDGFRNLPPTLFDHRAVFANLTREGLPMDHIAAAMARFEHVSRQGLLEQDLEQKDLQKLLRLAKQQAEGIVRELAGMDNPAAGYVIHADQTEQAMQYMASQIKSEVLDLEKRKGGRPSHRAVVLKEFRCRIEGREDEINLTHMAEELADWLPTVIKDPDVPLPKEDSIRKILQWEMKRRRAFKRQ